MSNDFLRYHQDSLAEVTPFLGSPFTYGGDTYTGIINDLEMAHDLMDGGWLTTIATIILVQKCDLATVPKEGEKLTANGKQLRIKTVCRDEVSYTLTCETAAK